MNELHATEERAGLRRLIDGVERVGFARQTVLALSALTAAFGVATFWSLTTSEGFISDRQELILLLYADLVLLLVLSALIAWRIVRVWAERRRGLAGSRLHVRLVLLFSVVAVVPAIAAAVFSLLIFNYGIRVWFSEPVRTAVYESLSVTDAYLDEHQKAIRADVLAMAGELNRDAALYSRLPQAMNQALMALSAQASVPEAVVFDGSGRILASSMLSFALQLDPPSETAMAKARSGEVVIMANPGEDRVRALVQLERYIDTYLYVARFIEPAVLGSVERAEKAVAEFEKVEGTRTELQTNLFTLFAMVALLLMLAAIAVGLMFATRLAGPISGLIAAAERVRAGDLSARVDEAQTDDEIGLLSRAFNRMTRRLERQQQALIEANKQLDARREFTETVLAGVSAGVIGVDTEGLVTLPNRSAVELLNMPAQSLIGQPLAEAVPEMRGLLEAARTHTEIGAAGEVDVIRRGAARTLLVRITAERIQGAVIGYVVTFDDITELQAAERKAAWADVARRIAHEIKNPLTPIQLSAERLKRRYLKQITADREVFEICVDTIVRQVGDIGRMVDEFSSFARMPAPELHPCDLRDVCAEAVFLQRNAHPRIRFDCQTPDEPVMLLCDRRQVSQAVTNLLQNAADSIREPEEAKNDQPAKGRVWLGLERRSDTVVIEVEDDGPGLPAELQHRLTEPYVTTRRKGTGLGLAIVRKIMEDHRGRLELENREVGGARARLTFRAEDGGAAKAADGGHTEEEKAAIHGS